MSSWGPHHGEEDPIRGWRGSGTVFFSRCNLKCDFCQNSGISQLGEGREATPGALAGIFLALQQAGAGQITAAQAQANVIQAATLYVQQVAQLQAAGVQNLAVLNVYDLGKSPYGVASGPAVAAQISQIVSLYNNTVQTGLGALGGNVLRVDAAAIFNDILANASAYGLANTTSMAGTAVARAASSRARAGSGSRASAPWR